MLILTFNPKCICTSLLLLMLLLPGIAFSQPSVIVEADVLNVRSKPWGERIGRVYDGQQFLVEERQGEWGRIIYKTGEKGWISLDYTRQYVAPVPTVSEDKYCTELNAEFDLLGWKDIRCRPEEWKSGGTSVQGRPLLYNEIKGAGPSLTLMICSVHSDENTCYQCFRLNDMLRKNPHLLINRLIIVPLLNPDGFLRKKKTRTNAHGVDLNRNLPSSDWQKLAINAWIHHYSRDPRRNPGPNANSEPENHFLLDLIEHMQPDKIISIHSPLNFLDLDFLEQPSDDQNLRQVSEKATALAADISKNSNFRFRSYNTFPGSLGRYGSEWRIPIFTLELPDVNPSLSASFFTRVRDSLVHSFNVILDDRKRSMANSNGPDMSQTK